MNMLADENCKPYAPGSTPLSSAEVADLARHVDKDWQVNGTGKAIERVVRFKDYYQTIAFVNAVAFIANQEDHHPALNVTYDACRITFDTHTVGGLSRNDFICAAKIDRLLG